MIHNNRLCYRAQIKIELIEQKRKIKSKRKQQKKTTKKAIFPIFHLQFAFDYSLTIQLN